MYQRLLIIAISLGLKIIGIYWHIIGIEDLTKAEGGSAPSAPSRRAPRVGAHPAVENPPVLAMERDGKSMNIIFIYIEFPIVIN